MAKHIIEKDLSYELVGIFFEVQNELGRFSRERQYGDAIAQKLQERGIEFEREWFFEVGGRKSNVVDFLIRGRVVIEIKAKPLLERQDFHQAQRYFETSGKELAFLVNFRDKFLKPRRILNARMYKPTMPNALNQRNVFVDSDRFVDSGRSTGQAMIVTTLFISGLILVATTVAGFLVSMQIRQATDTEMSGRAIFAADAGIESALFCYRHEFHAGEEDLGSRCGRGETFEGVQGEKNTSYRTFLRFKGAEDAPDGFFVDSEGVAGSGSRRVRRVLQTFFKIES